MGRSLFEKESVATDHPIGEYITHFVKWAQVESVAITMVHMILKISR